VLLSLFDMEVWSEATATAVAAAPRPVAAAAVLVNLANALHTEVRLHCLMLSVLSVLEGKNSG